MDNHKNHFSDNYKDDTDKQITFDGGFQEISIKAGDSADAKSSELAPKVSADSIAEYLLRKKLILTALEYHMELLESGRELHRLRNFFSNPANFEQQGNVSTVTPNTLYRSGSISTFDSLDLTHSEDDALADDRVAVLEFELRQAHETIKNLRMSLTGALDEDSFLEMESIPECKHSVTKLLDIVEVVNEDDCNPVIKRAMNYLINEYLLQNGYKLSSITLAEEIGDQDFEDWDDVGLNMPKPPNLLKLLQEYYSRHLHKNRNPQESAVNTDDYLYTIENRLKCVEDELQDREKENADHRRCYVFKEDVTSEVNPVSMNPELTMHLLHSSFCGHESCLEHSSLLTENTKCKVLSQFWDQLYCFWRKSYFTEEELFKEIMIIQSDADHLISFVTKALPDIIFLIDAEKRDRVIPLLVSIAAVQNDALERYHLIHRFFNFIEKPEKKQRQVILSGLIAYSKVVGVIQTEEDVLPHFWEQIGHKFPERRHLVAEACGAIAPWLRPEMRSLAFSILRQMEQEESNEKVRIAIMRSFTVVVTLLEDADKYLQSYDIVCAFVNDCSSSVREDTRMYLLPAFACWSRSEGRFCSHLVDKFLQEVESSFGLQDRKRTFPHFDVAKFLISLENLRCLLPSLFSDILLTMPTIDNGRSDCTVHRSQTLCSSHFPLVKFQDEVYQINFFFDSEELFLELFKAFSCTPCDVDMTEWRSLSFLLYNVMPRLEKIVKSVPLEAECVSGLCTFFSAFVLLFGVEFVRNHVAEQYFNMHCSKDQEEESPLHLSLTSSAVAVYACGILGTTHLVVASDKLISFLTDNLIALSSSHVSLESLRVSLVELRKKDHSFWDIILDVLWSGVTHASKYVRAGAGNLLEVMAVSEVAAEIRETRVLTALLVLAKDRELTVKISTLHPLGALMECCQHNDNVIDKIIDQLSSFMAPTDTTADDHAMSLGMVEIMGQVTPKADPKFCNDFVLPHLAAIAVKNNQEANITKRSDMAQAMLKTFTDISFCYISEGLLQTAFIPGLRCLLKDMEKVNTSCVSRVEKLIKDMEVKMRKRATPPHSEHGPNNSEKINSKFYGKLF